MAHGSWKSGISKESVELVSTLLEPNDLLINRINNILEPLSLSLCDFRTSKYSILHIHGRYVHGWSVDIPLELGIL